MNLTFDLINQSTATDDIQFWKDPERKGWTEADHKFYDQLHAESADLSCLDSLVHTELGNKGCAPDEQS